MGEMRQTFLQICLGLALLPCYGAQPVRLVSHLEKFRTFYAIDDSRIPAALKEVARTPPAGAITAIAIASDGAVWYGTRDGLVRFNSQTYADRQYQYFAGMRYLPDDEIQQLAADPDRGMWVRTRTGVSHIELRLMTLADKAELFEERIKMRHDRHGLVSPSHLRVAGDVATNEMRDDDNDGLWTSMYAAAECFRYAVTKLPEALANAKKATEAVLFLEEVTGKHGFPARSYIGKGGPMPRDGEWHWTADGRYYWKGDTSSDEIVGHMFLYSIAFDLLPDASLKMRIAETARRIVDHILEHHYYLVGPNGKPTTWGRWSPEYFDHERADSPLNSLELLSFLKCAAHITSDQKYETEYQKAAITMGYAHLATRYLEFRSEINYSDEELAMLAFYGLFRYERDEDLKNRYYRVALNAWWQNERREENPLWAIIYASSLPDVPTDLGADVRTLYEMPIDTIDWAVKNSQRLDVTIDAAIDRFGLPQVKTLLPRDELPTMKWNGNPFVVDSNGAGHGEDDGAAFLLPYWMGRFCRLLIGA